MTGPEAPPGPEAAPPGGPPPASPPAASAPAPERASRRRIVAASALLFVLSLLLRWAVFAGAGAGQAKPLYDERGYLDQATGFSQIWSDLGHGREPSPASWKQAYRDGVWPPGYPALLGLALWWFGATAGVARITVMAVSALTTVLVYLLTRRLAGERAGLAAAGAHLVFPSFVFFGHLLWSETAFHFSALVAVWAAVEMRRADRAAGRVAAAGLYGLAVGASVLVRVTALPWLLLAPLWPLLVLRRRRGAWIAVVLAAGLSLAVVAPWQAALSRAEGRFVLLSTASGYNLLLGADSGGGKSDIRRAIARRARERKIHPDQAARELAVDRIRRDPGAFLGRTLERASGVWRGDEIVFRHLLRTVYPPRPPAAAVLVLSLILVSEALLLAVSLFGIARWPAVARPERILLLLAIASVLAPPLLTVGNTRMVLPVLALALPFAGQGLASAVERPPRRGALALGLLVLAAFAFNLRLGGASADSFEPSSYYARALPRIDGWFGTRTAVSDCVELRSEGGDPAPGPEIRVSLSGGYHLGGGEIRSVTWNPLARRILPLRVRAERPEGPLEIGLNAGMGRSAVVRPIDGDFWMRWRPSGLAGVEVRWCGGGGPSGGGGGGARPRRARGESGMVSSTGSTALEPSPPTP